MSTVKAIAVDGEAARRLRAAFPRAVSAQVDAALGFIVRGQHAPLAHDIGPVVVDGEGLHVPARVYFPQPTSGFVAHLPEASRHVLACIFTRHHDGFVREEFVRRLLALERQPWESPYLLQLAGEYVVEIVEVLSQEVERLRGEPLATFAAQNPRFVCAVRHRIISYWDCYHQAQFRRFDDHPGYRLMSELGLWDRRDARRMLVHSRR